MFVLGRRWAIVLKYSRECLFFCKGYSGADAPSKVTFVALISKGCFASGVRMRLPSTITAAPTLYFVTDTTGKMQVYPKSQLTDFYTITKREYSFLSAIPAGFNKTIKTVGNYWKELKLIFSPKTEAYKSVGSFITIGSIFPDTWNWKIFWNLTAFLSVMLAVLNILPIPALDGGHLLFTLYEMVTGKKPSDKFLEYAQTAGMIILFAIMILALGNDFFRLFN